MAEEEKRSGESSDIVPIMRSQKFALVIAVISKTIYFDSSLFIVFTWKFNKLEVLEKF